MKENLKENERIDDLQYKGLKIIQNTKGFCFGIDSVILSDFAKNIKKGSKVVDLGTGTGIIGLLLCKKTELKEIVGVEIQKEVAEMANRSIKLNKLEDKFKILNTDINKIFEDKLLEKNKFDVVVMNPPYKEKGTGKINEVDSKIISRHEVKATLSDFIKMASNLLKDKGEIYIVHKPERMPDIIQKMRENKIEPKEIKTVYSNKKTEASLILIKGIKGAKKFFKILEPLYIYEENGEYTKEIKEIYNIGE
ncbi:methyltransferase type 11 [Clostridium sp. CAG:780]|jgi:ribosomal protein L11 methyltransferase (prmA)|nr:methyltransferase type 11 [Clostridium sp. CAG:780]